MGVHKIAVIPGDGIGPEVIGAGVAVLRELEAVCPGLHFETEVLHWNSDRYLTTGTYMPEDGSAMLCGFDAIYFGAVGDRRVPDHVSLWGLRLAICHALDQYANVRPIRLLPGVESKLRTAEHLDWLIIRENSEGEYAGHGGRVHKGHGEEVATETAVFTRTGIERVMRFAFGQARQRTRKHLTVVTKSNAQRFGLVLWDEVSREIATDFPDVRCDWMLVDAMAARMVERPSSIDTVVATNLHADILSDLAAAIAGSLGIAPTGNLNPERRFPSMFEPIHGSAFDIAGKGIANPIGAFWSAVLMLEHQGEQEAAARLMRGIEGACEQRIVTPDLGGSATTDQVTEAVQRALR